MRWGSSLTNQHDPSTVPRASGHTATFAAPSKYLSPTHTPCTYKPREHQRQVRRFFLPAQFTAHAPMTQSLSFGLILLLLAATMRALESSLQFSNHSDTDVGVWLFDK